MSVLNLGAQAVGLVRSSTDIEDVLQSCSGLKKIRSLNEENPALEVKAKILKSVQQCKVLLAGVFCRLTYSKIPLQIFEPATSESIDDLWSQMGMIDPTLSRGDTTRAIVQSKIKFQEFYEKHCRDRHHQFSVKKCNDLECEFTWPLKLQILIRFNIYQILFLMESVTNHFYGTETKERYRPSLTTGGQTEHRNAL